MVAGWKLAGLLRAGGTHRCVVEGAAGKRRGPGQGGADLRRGSPRVVAGRRLDCRPRPGRPPDPGEPGWTAAPRPTRGWWPRRLVPRLQDVVPGARRTGGAIRHRGG